MHILAHTSAQVRCLNRGDNESSQVTTHVLFGHHSSLSSERSWRFLREIADPKAGTWFADK
jgi:hypothetical protein